MSHSRDKRRAETDPSQHDPRDQSHESEEAGATPEEEHLSAEEQIEALRAERDDAIEKWKRSMADFQNFQRRAAQNEREARQQGVRSVVHGVLTAMDHFDLALQQNPETTSAEQILSGVRVIRDEIMRVLETHGVSPIEPAPDEPFDANRHEAMLHQEGEGVTPGHVLRTLQIGYALDARVIRPAKVAVARGSAGDGAGASRESAARGNDG